MLSNISYRYKIPASLIAVIVVTALAVAVPLISSANDASRRDLIDHALQLGKTLSRTLQAPLLHDDLWQAYEIVTTPFDRPLEQSLAQRAIVVIDAHNAVYVATDPKRYPSTQPLSSLGLIGQRLSGAVARTTDAPSVFEDVDPDLTIMTVPILASDQTRLGTVILEYSRDIFVPRLAKTVRSAASSTALILLILVPLGWLWGKRIAGPLLQLSDAIARVPATHVEEMEIPPPRGRDEIARLGEAFRTMLGGLREKAELEQQMLASERLAAVGRLTAGIAHEINNPLGGMLNAISNYKRLESSERSQVQRTMSLLERGLLQIRQTVGALLVQARFESHAVTPHDFEDVRMLLLPNVEGKHIQLAWDNRLKQPLPLPSTEVRQIMLNLMLNAVEAADRRGNVRTTIAEAGHDLVVEVENDGAGLSEHQIQHLFEPFAESRTKGKGLGLWMTYQLASQLKGRIEARSEAGQTVFTVTLPLAA
jgi:two-component system, NtrC family, sensor kinase